MDDEARALRSRPRSGEAMSLVERLAVVLVAVIALYVLGAPIWALFGFGAVILLQLADPSLASKKGPR